MCFHSVRTYNVTSMSMNTLVVVKIMHCIENNEKEQIAFDLYTDFSFECGMCISLLCVLLFLLLLLLLFLVQFAHSTGMHCGIKKEPTSITESMKLWTASRGAHTFLRSSPEMHVSQIYKYWMVLLSHGDPWLPANDISSFTSNSLLFLDAIFL